MALLSLPRSRQPKHARPTPLLEMIGLRRRPVVPLTEKRVITPPSPEPTPAAPAAPVLPAADTARALVERVFPAGADGLYPLDWQYGLGYAVAEVDPGLIPDEAHNVVLAYAAVLGAEPTQEDYEGRLRMRTSRVVDGVQVTVWADITPDPEPAEVEPAPEPGPVPEVESDLPIEREVRCVLDDTAVFPAITDDMPDPRHDPDGDLEREPTGPDHVATPDPVDTADEPTEDTAEADAGEHDDTDALADDSEDTASTTDDTSSTPLPPGDEDEEETHSHG